MLHFLGRVGEVQRRSAHAAQNNERSDRPDVATCKSRYSNRVDANCPVKARPVHLPALIGVCRQRERRLLSATAPLWEGDATGEGIVVFGRGLHLASTRACLHETQDGSSAPAPRAWVHGLQSLSRRAAATRRPNRAQCTLTRL
jgi:hypothetical protein